MRWSREYREVYESTRRQLEKTGGFMDFFRRAKPKEPNPATERMFGIGSKERQALDTAVAADPHLAGTTTDQVLKRRGIGSKMRSSLFGYNPEQIIEAHKSYRDSSRMPYLVGGAAMGTGGTLGAMKLLENRNRPQASQQEYYPQQEYYQPEEQYYPTPEEAQLLAQYYGGQYR